MGEINLITHDVIIVQKHTIHTLITMDWNLLPVFAGVELKPHADVDLPIPQLVTSQEPIGDQTPAGTRNTKKQ